MQAPDQNYRADWSRFIREIELGKPQLTHNPLHNLPT